jgi:very-short-patch-repair endonuclease
MRGNIDLEHRIAEFAAAHHAVASHAELRRLGLGVKAIDYRVAIGRLHPRHRGVYSLGHKVLTREGRWRAAALAGGSKAALSGKDAAALWGLMATQGSRIDVTTRSRSGRDPDPKRIRLHRTATLRAWETTVHDRIPITTVARTLLDLSPLLRPRALEDVIAQSDRLGLFDLVAVRRCLAEHPRQPGAPALRKLLDNLRSTDAADLRSPLEVRFLQLCDDHQLPTPQTNVPLAGFLVDFHWPPANLIVETDGFAYHSTRSAFEVDRARDQALTLAGYTVVRFTDNQLTQQPAVCAERLRRLLS